MCLGVGVICGSSVPVLQQWERGEKNPTVQAAPLTPRSRRRVGGAWAAQGEWAGPEGVSRGVGGACGAQQAFLGTM